MHQQEFRQRVLRAYRERCAICRLRHEELLDAAHILPDGPMLRYGLQGFQDARLLLPRDPALRPNREFVEERYGMFRKAG